MSKRKDETAAEYSARMSAYQLARRKGKKPEAVAPKKPFPKQPVKSSPAYSRLGILEANIERAKITLPGPQLSKEAKPMCYGDLRRLEFERAGKIGAPTVSPVTQTANGKRRAHESALFKEQMRPIIAKLTGTVTVTAIIAGVKRPHTINRDRAALLIAGLLKEAGAERVGCRTNGPHYWRMPTKEPLTISRPRAVGGHASKSKIRPDTPGDGKATQRPLKREIAA